MGAMIQPGRIYKDADGALYVVVSSKIMLKCPVIDTWYDAILYSDDKTGKRYELVEQTP